MTSILYVNNLKYKGVPEINRTHPCNGCAFHQLENCHDGFLAGCSTKKIIWVLDTEHKNEGLVQQEQKYTVKEVLHAINKTWDFDNASLDQVIKETTIELQKRSDPEYVKYLELKQIYAPDK